MRRGAPSAVEHNRYTEIRRGPHRGRRSGWESTLLSVERLFPPSGGVSRGSVRVGGKTFLLPFYGFSFGYKRKGVNIAALTGAERDVVERWLQITFVHTYLYCFCAGSRYLSLSLLFSHKAKTKSSSLVRGSSRSPLPLRAAPLSALHTPHCSALLHRRSSVREWRNYAIFFAFFEKTYSTQRHFVLYSNLVP